MPARALRASLAALAALALALAGRGRALGAQTIMAAPQAVVVDARTRTGALTLLNTGDASVEVTLSTLYGYPVTDSAGRMTLRTIEATDDTMPSAARWVRFFPERLVLPAGGRRTVRLLVTPPPGLPDGEYWSRIVATARGGTLAADGGAGIGIGLALEVRSVLGMFYRQGRVATGVALDTARFALEGDSVAVRARLTRQGSAAFVGTLRTTLRDASGATRAAASLPVGVYYTLEPRLAVSRRGLPPGTYTAVVEAVSARPDVPASAIVQAPARRVAYQVVVP